MRIVYRDKSCSIDRAAYTAFLKAQGFTEGAIACLNIYVQQRRNDPDTLGSFRRPSTIFLSTEGQAAEEINITLLHETRHYWQEQEREQRRYVACQQLKRRAYEKFLMAWMREPEREHAVDYWGRPCEQDARAFADEYQATAQFIRLT
jgi:hypothetical protein